MMFSTTRSLRRVGLFRQPAMRAFATIVPIEKASRDPPAEVLSTPLTNAHFAQLQEQYAEFNEGCKVELQTMNKNIIESIVDRGGNDGWNTTEDAMTKSFAFDSFEQCQHFCDEVSKFANEKDHHPEWSLSNAGCTVDVKLTSHFAGNKVTRLDFELGEAMNKQYAASIKGFRMYPRFERSQLVSMQIAAMCLLAGGVLYKAVSYTEYDTREQRADLFPVLPADFVKIKELPRTQMEATELPTSVAIANQNKYYESRSPMSPVSSL